MRDADVIISEKCEWLDMFRLHRCLRRLDFILLVGDIQSLI